ncbi:unnamed protein product [Rotaria socialis]|nr:unnamed protein product [Rotaria socialis]
MFPSTYMKPVIVSGKPTESDLSSVITHTNHIGLRQHLASNNKILLNDDADLIAETYGLYNVNDFTKEHERNVILCGYDGFTNTSRTTGTTIIHIGDKRLTITIATTGGKLMKNMKNWINFTGFDGSHNRFLYMSIPKLVYSRPQNFIVNINSKKNPSITHLCVIIHLFGTVRTLSFSAAIFDQPSTPVDEDEQTQTQQNPSAMFTLWNLIADLVETQDQKQDQQQQIVDFYAKAGTTFPRLACLMQLYFNAIEILERVKNTVVFAEGDNHDMSINENFVNSVKSIIQKDYYAYNKTYLPCIEINQSSMDPIIIVEKEALIAAWKWYDHHLNIAAKLFTIDPEFPGKPLSISSSVLSRQKTLKQLIMLLDFNIFPVSSISVKHPVTGQTGIIKNRPALGERALQELLEDNLLKFNYFLTDIRGRNIKSYMKIPIPSINDETREQFVTNLLKHEINIDEYYSIYEKSAIPLNNNLSKLALEIFEYTSSFVNQYAKYKNQLNVIIKKHVENRYIEETEDGHFIIKDQNVFALQFHDIENLVLGQRQEQINNRALLSITNQPISSRITKSTKELKRTTAIEVDKSYSVVAKNCERQSQELPDVLIDQPDIDTAEAFVSNENELSSDFDDSSIATVEKQINVRESLLSGTIEDETCAISTQKTIQEAASVYGKGPEQMVKKAMQSIMGGRSVIYTKTDLTQICNKSAIRLEAVKRLVAANLLEHGNDFWIEPSRTKKELKKPAKRILREGWLKKVPESESNASKFRFIQMLQENVNITYEDYLKTFYPNQDENVFSHNNWTLSDELIEIINSNTFYLNHVRWNIQRFRPSDITRSVVDAEDSINIEEPHMNNSATQETLEQQIIMNNNDAGILAHVLPRSTCSKRKAEINVNVHERQMRTQPRRMKKN